MKISLILDPIYFLDCTPISLIFFSFLFIFGSTSPKEERKAPSSLGYPLLDYWVSIPSHSSQTPFSPESPMSSFDRGVVRAIHMGCQLFGALFSGSLCQ